MITHAATLDISPRLLRMVTHVINQARQGPGRLPRTRAATARTQALLVIHYLRDAPPIWRLARDAAVSTATAYRYLHKGLDALAEQSPTLTEAITQAMDENQVSVLCLDGTLVPTDRVDVHKPDGRHLFYSDKHKALGVNAAVIATTDGDPIPNVGVLTPPSAARASTRTSMSRPAARCWSAPELWPSEPTPSW